MNSVNKLFSQMNDAFMFRDILQSASVLAPRTVAAICANDAPQPAMTLWLMECGAAVRDYQLYMAQVRATQIRDWLRAGKRATRC